MPVQVALDWDCAVSGDLAPERLLCCDPETWPVAADWAPYVASFWLSEAGRGLQQFLRRRLAAGDVIFPPRPLRGLELTPLNTVRVVILGQDPYHGAGQAEGLAFSVSPGVKVPPSLRNIFKELQREGVAGKPENGSLVRWAEQGVLLLNTCLTVEESAPASHSGRGWEVLTDALVKACSEDASPKVFLLWGAHAQKKAALIDGQRHRVLCANHPSPLSASRGPLPFLGCGHFAEANRWLANEHLPLVHW